MEMPSAVPVFFNDVAFYRADWVFSNVGVRTFFFSRLFLRYTMI